MRHFDSVLVYGTPNVDGLSAHAPPDVRADQAGCLWYHPPAEDREPAPPPLACSVHLAGRWAIVETPTHTCAVTGSTEQVTLLLPVAMLRELAPRALVEASPLVRIARQLDQAMERADTDAQRARTVAALREAAGLLGTRHTKPDSAPQRDAQGALLAAARAYLHAAHWGTLPHTDPAALADLAATLNQAQAAVLGVLTDQAA